MSVRKSTLSVAAWAFGFSVTVLLIALWGRAVVVDADTLGESLAPLAESTPVVDAFAGWAEDEMVEAGADPVLIEPTIEHILGSASIGQSLEGVVADVVDAAASSDPRGSAVDMRRHLEPAVPEVAAGLSAAGVEVSESALGDLVDGLGPFVIRQPGTAAIVGPDSPAAARLGTATLIGFLGILLFGSVVLTLTPDRVAAMRDLSTRVALGGLGFALLLRLGSWILDPSGGQAPIAETAAALAGSKWMVPFRVGLGAGVFAVVTYLMRRQIRQVAVSLSGYELPIPPEEPELSLSGSSSGHDY